MKLNPILLEVFNNRFASISEEMGVCLMRTAYSPNIKERRDFSCALFDPAGEMVAQAAHIPVHLGSMPMSVKAAVQSGPMAQGDMVILNDPFKGGTHLPDVTLVAPVFDPQDPGGGPVFYAANRAHHADVGGMAPGSMPLSTSLYQEGMIIPPLKLVEKGEIDKKLLGLILNNVRTPGEREGDFASQIMANITGVKRCRELMDKYGRELCVEYARGLIDHAERMTRAALEKIPEGRYDFEDFLDNDGQDDHRIPIRLDLCVDRDSVLLDFSRSGDQARGCLNAVGSIAVSAALYVFRCLIRENIPTNGGCLRPITVKTRKGSIVDASFPAAVAGGNVETSQRIVDVILGALSKAMPGLIPAASQGTMNNIAIGGTDPEHGPFAYYETLAGGMGGSGMGPGESAVHSHMTNTLNTPVEAMEYAYPFRVREYSIRKGSGGQGVEPGGDGLVREIELLVQAEATVLSERRETTPYGLGGGETGQPGKNTLVLNGESIPMPGKFQVTLAKGDRIRIETPGGGGWAGKSKSKAPPDPPSQTF